MDEFWALWRELSNALNEMLLKEAEKISMSKEEILNTYFALKGDDHPMCKCAITLSNLPGGNNTVAEFPAIDPAKKIQKIDEKLKAVSQMGDNSQIRSVVDALLDERCNLMKVTKSGG